MILDADPPPELIQARPIGPLFADDPDTPLWAQAVADLCDDLALVLSEVSEPEPEDTESESEPGDQADEPVDEAATPEPVKPSPTPRPVANDDAEADAEGQVEVSA